MSDESKADMTQKGLDEGVKQFIQTVLYNTAIRFSGGGHGLEAAIKSIDAAWDIRDKLMEHYGVKK